MKIVVLTANSTYVDYIIGRVDETLGVAKVIHVNLVPQRTGFLQQLRRLFKAQLLYYLEQRFFYRPLSQLQDQLVTQLLSPPKLSPRLLDKLNVLATDLNSAETAAKIRALEPDILLVCSSPLLKPEIFSIPTIATLNIHFGIAPAYRGDNTIFWPLYYRDYRNIGVTIHRITAGIDAGPIVSQEPVSVEPTDDIVSLHAKDVVLATDLVIEALSIGDPKVLGGIPQTKKGRLFLYRARRVWHDAALFLRTFCRRDRLPQLPEVRIANTKEVVSEDVAIS